jgi:hypothetical protein
MIKPKKKTSKKKMEPSIKPSQDEGAANSSEKVFDIARPGQEGVPSATSRPFITTHRTLVRDPMMVAQKSESETTTEEATAKPVASEEPHTSKLRIEPLVSSEDTEDEKPETSEKLPAETSESTALDEEKDPAIDTSSFKAEAKNPEAPAADGKEDEDMEEMNDYASQAAAKQAKKTEDSEESKRLKAAEALIESKQYHVPINAVHRRRTARAAITFLIVVLVSVGGAAYLLLG